jgi:hypothetical protein
MVSTGMNYWAVLVAAIAYMALGALWYSPVLFGKAWMKGIGKTKEQVDAGFSPLNYLYSIIAAFLSSYGIARIMNWSGGNSVVDGIKVALIAGICFVLAAMAVNDIFEKRPRSLTVINVLYHVAGFVVCGIIIGVWR